MRITLKTSALHTIVIFRTMQWNSTDEYTNMVYVDDLSGQGSSLISSEARLVIIGSDRTEEVVLNPNEENANGQRYNILVISSILDIFCNS